MLLRHIPIGPLAAFVESVWYSARGALPHSREHSLPTGCCDIVIPLLQDDILRYEHEDAVQLRRLHGGVLQGPHDRYSVRGTEGPSAVVGVHFRAGGAAALFGGALPALRNRTVLLEDLWGLTARDLREQLQHAPSPEAALRLVQAHLLRRLRIAPPAAQESAECDAGIARELHRQTARRTHRGDDRNARGERLLHQLE